MSNNHYFLLEKINHEPKIILYHDTMILYKFAAQNVLLIFQDCHHIYTVLYKIVEHICSKKLWEIRFRLCNISFLTYNLNSILCHFIQPMALTIDL